VLSPAKLSSKLPPKEPCYTFYAWPSALAARQPTTLLEETPSAQRELSDMEDLDSTPTSAAIESSQPNNITMIYTCPSASPVRYRMIYSSSLRGVMKEASTLIGLTIDRKVILIAPLA
jgi:twinfilin-like protein